MPVKLQPPLRAHPPCDCFASCWRRVAPSHRSGWRMSDRSARGDPRPMRPVDGGRHDQPYNTASALPRSGDNQGGCRIFGSPRGDRAARGTRAGRGPGLDVRRRALAAIRACRHHPFLRTPPDGVMKRTPFFSFTPDAGSGVRAPGAPLTRGRSPLGQRILPRLPASPARFLCRRSGRLLASRTRPRPPAGRPGVAPCAAGSRASLNRATPCGIHPPLSAPNLSLAGMIGPRLPHERSHHQLTRGHVSLTLRVSWAPTPDWSGHGPRW